MFNLKLLRVVFAHSLLAHAGTLFIDKLEHLPDLDAEELKQLSDQVKHIRARRKR